MDRLHTTTLGDLLREQRRSRRLEVAVVDEDTRLTYAQLDERVNRLADALRTAGFAAGDRILWLGQNSHRVFEAFLAAAKLGGALCPVNWRQSPAELAFVLEDAAARVVLWQEEEVGETVRAARALLADDSARWIQHDGDGADGYERFLESGAAVDHDFDVDPGSPVLQMYSSATSGRPNGALLSHTGFLDQAIIQAWLMELDHTFVYLASGALFHIWTFQNMVNAFALGGKVVFTAKADAEEMCRLIDAERCTHAMILQPTIEKILEVNADRRYDLSSMRHNAGFPAWQEMTSRDESPYAHSPNGYGQTEVMGMFTYNAIAPGTVGTHGRPHPLVQVRVFDPDGVEVPDGEVGEIVARGPTVMYGYWNRPDENAYRQDDGWHHTRDLGRREPDGTISFVGPATQMVKSAAENIFAAEVEGALNSHPAVKESAIIGVPDPKWVQNVKAIVVLHDGHTATADELIDHCRERIASYKKPKTVEFTDALPRAGFAIDYRALDDRYGGGGYPGGTNRSA